jgi:hypothetical protein
LPFRAAVPTSRSTTPGTGHTRARASVRPAARPTSLAPNPRSLRPSISTAARARSTTRTKIATAIDLNELQGRYRASIAHAWAYERATGRSRLLRVNVAVVAGKISESTPEQIAGGSRRPPAGDVGVDRGHFQSLRAVRRCRELTRTCAPDGCCAPQRKPGNAEPHPDAVNISQRLPGGGPGGAGPGRATWSSGSGTSPRSGTLVERTTSHHAAASA